eukprot:CAMPEP_0184358872 /NCGR_PEP_ID=MMETSP1089-20130417/117209_1 /TAXON_ID=38269 ORGANISM="Gloeochaete wittrockiana, Strain SAG46.84" /NCGR_SAMPLE_ID=MMETSP1089 /ASSEMBLY_ACC=CAM_ASM_000445 /LENGTH=61 /DNA_ID=CAMNT_0026697429 /DNA_START=186 /DNA_END=371 /DNA_ORIENTATION=-
MDVLDSEAELDEREGEKEETQTTMPLMQVTSSWDRDVLAHTDEALSSKQAQERDPQHRVPI